MFVRIRLYEYSSYKSVLKGETYQIKENLNTHRINACLSVFFCHLNSIGKSSMTKNMTIPLMMMSRNRGRMSQSPIHVFPLLPKSLFTISEDDNSNTIETQYIVT